MNKLEVYGKLDSDPIIPTYNNHLNIEIWILLTVISYLAS